MESKYTVYVLWSEKLRKRYVGCTSNLMKRIHDHNSGGTHFTKRGIPWRLLHEESYPDLVTARKREKFLKRGIGRKWLDQLLKGKPVT